MHTSKISLYLSLVIHVVNDSLIEFVDMHGGYTAKQAKLVALSWL